MPDRTTLADLGHALRTIDWVLVDNAPKHGDRWRRETVYSHVAHAVAHLDVWRTERSPEDLEHALVRVARPWNWSRPLHRSRPG